MPKDKRDILKRHTAHAMYDITIAMQHIGVVYDTFEPVHPEMAENLMTAIQGCEAIATLLKAFAAEAWGKDVVNWEGWRHMSSAQLELQEPVDPDLDEQYHQTASRATRQKHAEG